MFWSLRRNAATPIRIASDRTAGSMRPDNSRTAVPGCRCRITRAASSPPGGSGNFRSSRHAPGWYSATAAIPRSVVVAVASTLWPRPSSATASASHRIRLSSQRTSRIGFTPPADSGLRQPEADTRSSACAPAAFHPSAIPHDVAGHGRQAEAGTARDFAKPRSAVFHHKRHQRLTLPDLNCDHAGWPCRTRRIIQNI